MCFSSFTCCFQLWKSSTLTGKACLAAGLEWRESWMWSWSPQRESLHNFLFKVWNHDDRSVVIKYLGTMTVVDDLKRAEDINKHRRELVSAGGTQVTLTQRSSYKAAKTTPLTRHLCLPLTTAGNSHRTLIYEFRKLAGIQESEKPMVSSVRNTVTYAWNTLYSIQLRPKH